MQHKINTGVVYQELDLRVKEACRLREEARVVSSQLKSINERINQAESLFLSALEKTEHNSWKVPGVGKLTRARRETFKMPEAVKDRQKVFKFFKDAGFYDEYVTVNSQKLNKFVKDYKDEMKKNHMKSWDKNAEHTKEEIEAHQKKLLEIEKWALPGLGEPSVHYYVMKSTN